jgi:hypothetical protein
MTLRQFTAGYFYTLLKGKVSKQPEAFALLDKYLVWSGRLKESEVERPDLVKEQGNIKEILKYELQGWKFAATKRNLPALVPSQAVEGDIIVIMFGADVPLLHRETEDGNFTQIGTSFVKPIMEGEVTDSLE